MKKSNGVIIFAVVVIVAFWVLIFAVGSDSPDTQGNSQQVGNIVDSSTSTTITTETTTETTTEESTTISETTTEEETTTEIEETITKKTETTTKKVTTTKKETTTKRTETTTKKQNNTTSNSDTMVWIPETGEKYHSKASCSGMNNPSKVTKKQAVEWGYTPCKRCH